MRVEAGIWISALKVFTCRFSDGYSRTIMPVLELVVTEISLITAFSEKLLTAFG